MDRLLITRGLPASGRTILARKLQPRVVRVNRRLGVFDDRRQVVRMWRELGLTVFQVAEGDF